MLICYQKFISTGIANNGNYEQRNTSKHVLLIIAQLITSQNVWPITSAVDEIMQGNVFKRGNTRPITNRNGDNSS